MLRRLTVENYVLIDRLDLELDAGLNIITGETGAGKSILLGALGLLLGSRAEGGVMKDEGRNCIIEGVFQVKGYGLEEFFAQNDLDYDNQVTVRRVISASGKSRAYVNDLPVQLTLLKDFGTRMIDIHSQHQSLMLASDVFRCGILDSVAGNRALLESYKTAHSKWHAAQRSLVELREKAQAEARDEEYLQFQAGQLKEAALQADEQQELEHQQEELSHAGQIREALSTCSALLDAEEYGILPRLKSAALSIGHTSTYYQRAGEFHERLTSVHIELRDIERELQSEAQRVEDNPELLQRTHDRLDLIYTLQRKHGVQSVAELIELREEYERRLAAITSSAENIEKLERQTAELHAAAEMLAASLSESRRTAATQVEQHVSTLLSQLGMSGARLSVEIASGGELRQTGYDTTRFMFAANRDATLQPVEKTASGGEISRLMLALKSLVAERSMLPTIIFDEIDTGVSGRIADAMGQIICSIGENMQVVNITHLPQVASKGDTHFVVYKQETPSGMVSSIRRLSSAERIEEIAKMLSGSHVTEAALSQARLLLNR